MCSQALHSELLLLSLVHRPGNNHIPSQPLCGAHPLLPIWRWWSYSTIRYPSLPDQVAHIGKVACLRPQETAVSWARTPAIRVTVEHSAAGLLIPGY